MEDRPFEFVYYCMKQRPHLLNIINNDILFCLCNPEFFIRKLRDIINDIFNRLKQLQINTDEGYHDIVVRNLVIGVSAGSNELKKYEKWIH